MHSEVAIHQEFGMEMYEREKQIIDFIRHVYASACEEVAKQIWEKVDNGFTDIGWLSMKLAKRIALDEGSNARKV